MAISTETDARWGEYLSLGYSLKERDGDVGADLYFKDAYITTFNQTTMDMDEVIKEAEIHRQEIMGGDELA